ncbi:MAG: helix-turn-helix domain-containing protein [Nitrosospira sp.]|nr:helix-turn-helix domain-containing protein [Nitrosospira sp.]MDN5937020.1 helix-turn-helix domain-containing protein [Nitrosospira sp.]
MADVTAKSLIAGIKEVADYKQGRVALETVEVAVPDIDVKRIRDRLGLSQDKFAEVYGLSVGTVRNWEHGKRKPEGPARILLNLIERQPDFVAQEVNKIRGRPRFVESVHT